jgi:hypothetical protein
MRISRLTVEKLGVKLYDSVSAVVAELIANSYDADADRVDVRLPLNSELARRKGKGDPTVVDAGYELTISDDGHGMTPDEAIDFYLRVGSNRRVRPTEGALSRHKHRPVMGRKGIGKLAPFGVCREIEVLSSGGEADDAGYLTAHFVMKYEDIVADTDSTVEFGAGPLDRTRQVRSGTTVTLRSFLPKRVPDDETFHRQLARRFLFARDDFQVVISDTRDPSANAPRVLDPLNIPLIANTHVDLSSRPVRLHDGTMLHVDGWLGLAQGAYKNEEMAGVRIYARDKLVATTRDFEQPAGYTGEYTMRSYLVGQVQAEWLDLDDGDDLIRTDRQNILWASDYGEALREWGKQLIREIGAASKKPRRLRKSELFLQKSDIRTRANQRFSDDEISDAAVRLGEQIGGFAAEDELNDPEYVDDLTEVVLSVAPHKVLIDAFAELALASGIDRPDIDSLTKLFGKAQVAEIASFGQIALERIKSIAELERIVRDEKAEPKLQELLARAPWLIEATWSIISANQGLRTFAEAFQIWHKKRGGGDVVLATGQGTKRPDFTLINVGQKLHIVEIKRAGHFFDDNDYRRLANYVEAFDEFLARNVDLASQFPLGYQIDVIADGENVKEPANRPGYRSMVEKGKVVRRTWEDFLLRAKLGHEAFLEAAENIAKLRKTRL